MNAEWEQWDVQEKNAQANKRRIEEEQRVSTLIDEHARMKKALESLRGLDPWISDVKMGQLFKRAIYETLDSLKP